MRIVAGYRSAAGDGFLTEAAGAIVDEQVVPVGLDTGDIQIGITIVVDVAECGPTDCTEESWPGANAEAVTSSKVPSPRLR